MGYKAHFQCLNHTLANHTFANHTLTNHTLTNPKQASKPTQLPHEQVTPILQFYRNFLTFNTLSKTRLFRRHTISRRCRGLGVLTKLVLQIYSNRQELGMVRLDGSSHRTRKNKQPKLELFSCHGTSLTSTLLAEPQTVPSVSFVIT